MTDAISRLNKAIDEVKELGLDCETDLWVVLDEIELAQKAVAFFASVIKSGEPWTNKCQEAYDQVFQTKDKGFGQFFYTDGENLLAEVSGSDKDTDDPEWDRKHIDLMTCWCNPEQRENGSLIHHDRNGDPL